MVRLDANSLECQILERRLAHAKYEKKRRSIRKAMGLCTECSHRHVRGKSLCKRCAERYRIKQREEEAWKKENKICLRCGKPVEEERRERRHCISCAKIRIELRKRKRITIQ